MSGPNCERWTSLSDQMALGQRLCDADREWFEQHARHCSHCGEEAQFWSNLGSVMGTPEILNEPIRVASRSSVSSLAPRLRGGYGWALGLAAGVCLTLGAAWLLREGSSRKVAQAPAAARFISVAGEVDMGTTAARAGATVSRSRSIRTHAGLACVALSDSITACLGENSEASLSLDDPTQLAVKLAQGHVLVRLEKQHEGCSFRVETPRNVVIAKGTVFSVSLDADQGTTVRLHEGHVTLRTAENQSGDLVAPAQAYMRQSIERRDWSSESAAADRQLLALSTLPRKGQATRLDVATHPIGAQVDVDGTPLGPTPISALMTSGSRLTVTMPGYAPVTELLPNEPGQTLERSFELAAIAPEETPPSEDARGAQGNVAPVTPSALLARAQALRSQGKYRECALVYRQLTATYPKSDEARVSLVSLGELELSELARPAQALQSFESYLRGGGPLTREAKYGRIRALQALGRSAELQLAITNFIHDYPQSVQATSLRQRTQLKP